MSFRKRDPSSNQESDHKSATAETSPAVAALIASVELTAAEMRDELSRYEIRRQIRERDAREVEQVWRPLRRAALAWERDHEPSPLTPPPKKR